MAYIRIILIIAILFCLSACHHSTNDCQTILQIERMMETAPDSALTLLYELNNSIQTKDKATQMYHKLLTTKAKDKCYIPHTSDSLMKVLVHYYEENGTSEQLMEAYYYLGSTYRDLHDAPRALNYFQKAADASTDSKEYKILGRIYGQIGTLYLYQKVYNEALPAFKKSYYYYSLAKDSLLIPYALRNLGRSFTALQNADSALHYYEVGYQVAKQINNSHQMSIIQSEKSDIYIQLKQYEQARTALIASSEKLKKEGNIAPHYLIWGDLYKGIGQLDSAELYYHKALPIGNIYVKKDSYWGLYQIKQSKSLTSEALKYINQYLIYQDSVQQITDTESIKKVQMLYNYHHIEKENDRLKLSYEKSKTLILQIVIGGIVSLTVLVGIFYYGRQKKEQRLEQESRLHYFNKMRYKESLEQLKKNNEQIAKLKEQLSLAHEQNELINEELLLIQQKSLEEKNNSIAAAHTEHERLVQLFHHSEIYLFIQEKSKEPDFKLTDDHWKKIQQEIDSTYDDFTDRLYALYPKLTEIELHVCYLVKMSVSVSDIAHFVIRHKTTICTIRERLYKKIYNVPGSTKDFDVFILNF